ncbi:MAG: hypothetical protein H0X31_17925 [Nostocaceae cyanobacterium]|nr:hypothetical protein [Nostocaceae cyanobacterium]
MVAIVPTLVASFQLKVLVLHKSRKKTAIVTAAIAGRDCGCRLNQTFLTENGSYISGMARGNHLSMGEKNIKRCKEMTINQGLSSKSSPRHCIKGIEEG